MSIKQCEDRLLDRGLRPTPARILTLRKLSELEYPVSLLELETMLDTLDKSTISRSLAVLLNVMPFIHLKMEADQPNMRFAEVRWNIVL